MTNIHLPRKPIGDEKDLWDWYGNVATELADLEFDPAARTAFEAYYVEAGLLQSSRRAFFRRHFGESFATAMTFFAAAGAPHRVLDLGCGTGTQALYLALHGIEVVAVDLDPLALATLARRQSFYERAAGRALPITIVQGDVFDLDFASFGAIDAVWSMFAFNMMQPSSHLLARLLPACAPRAKIAILDGNNRSLFARLVPSRRRNVWSPGQTAEALVGAGFEIVRHRGGVSLPPPVWSLVPRSLLTPLDDRLNRTGWAPVSHLVLARWAAAGEVT